MIVHAHQRGGVEGSGSKGITRGYIYEEEENVSTTNSRHLEHNDKIYNASSNMNPDLLAVYHTRKFHVPATTLMELWMMMSRLLNYIKLVKLISCINRPINFTTLSCDVSQQEEAATHTAPPKHHHSHQPSPHPTLHFLHRSNS